MGRAKLIEDFPPSQMNLAFSISPFYVLTTLRVYIVYLHSLLEGQARLDREELPRDPELFPPAPLGFS